MQSVTHLPIAALCLVALEMLERIMHSKLRKAIVKILSKIQSKLRSYAVFHTEMPEHRPKSLTSSMHPDSML